MDKSKLFMAIIYFSIIFAESLLVEDAKTVAICTVLSCLEGLNVFLSPTAKLPCLRHNILSPGMRDFHSPKCRACDAELWRNQNQIVTCSADLKLQSSSFGERRCRGQIFIPDGTVP